MELECVPKALPGPVARTVASLGTRQREGILAPHQRWSGPQTADVGQPSQPLYSWKKELRLSEGWEQIPR